MYIKILDLLVFNRIRFINTVIIKSISSTTGHVHLYAMHIGWTFGIKSKTYTYVLEDQVIISQIQAKTDPPIRLAIQYILLLNNVADMEAESRCVPHVVSESNPRMLASSK